MKEDLPSSDQLRDMINRIVKTHKRENVIADLKKLVILSHYLFLL
jgi:hypothetical protein